MNDKPILFLVCLLLAFLGVITVTTRAHGQAPVTDSAKKIREKITKIGIGGEITIEQRAAKTLHGAVVQINADTVLISEVDLKANVEVHYDQIKSVDKGYSHADPLTGKRMPPKTRKIIGWSVLAAVGVLIIVIAKGLSDPTF